MPVANVNGVNLNYEVTGNGKPIVLLHGMTGSTHDWENQIKFLSPKYKVIAMDHRGHGKSASPSRREAYLAKILVADVYELLKMLGINKCCLVGHSLSGRVALQFALEHQDLLATLVLVGTSSEALSIDSEFMKTRRKVIEIARTEGMAAAFEYNAANNPQSIELFKKKPEQREISRRKMMMTSIEAYAYIGGGMESVTSRLQEITIPTLIFRGEEDMISFDAVQILKDGISGSKLITVRGAGHSPHEDVPDIFNEDLLKFLTEVEW